MNPETNPVWYALGPAALLFAFGLACGGGGATFGENSPGNAAYGGGTYLDDAIVFDDTPEGMGENGSLAVDPDTEITYTLQKRMIDGGEEKRIVAVTPDGDSRVVLDVTDYVDVRVLFPPDSVLIMAEPAHSEEAVAEGSCAQPFDLDSERDRCGDDLIWFDKSSRRELKRRHTAARYHGTRLSPKRNYLVVADNFYATAPLHLLDTATGDTNVVRQDGAWFEGMWMHTEDALITAHFSRTFAGDADSDSFLTIREWFPAAGQTSAAVGQTICFHAPETPLPPDCEAYTIAGVDPMFFTGFSWIVISPDDRFVSVPAQRSDGRAVVVVVDRETRTLKFVEDAYGPVGFTPDSATMVAFGWDEPATNRFDEIADGAEGAHLITVDLATFEATREPTPSMETPTFFVSHDTNDVVVVNLGGSNGMLIMDLDAAASTRMSGSETAEAGRQFYGPAEIADADPTQHDDAVGERILRASDVVARDDIRTLGCREAMCETGQGSWIDLSEFVSRTGHRELWLVEAGTLIRVDLALNEAKTIEIDGTPMHINILPGLDRLVLDSRGEQQLRFFDPTSKAVDRIVSIELGWTAW